MSDNTVDDLDISKLTQADFVKVVQLLRHAANVQAMEKNNRAALISVHEFDDRLRKFNERIITCERRCAQLESENRQLKTMLAGAMTKNGR